MCRMRYGRSVMRKQGLGTANDSVCTEPVVWICCMGVSKCKCICSVRCSYSVYVGGYMVVRTIFLNSLAVTRSHRGSAENGRND